MNKIVIKKMISKTFPTFLGLLTQMHLWEFPKCKCDFPNRKIRKGLKKHAFSKTPKYEVFFAFQKNEPVGFLQIFQGYAGSLGTPILYIEKLFIKKENRGTKAGTALFEKAEKEAKKWKCGRMDWMALKTNKPAQAFYKTKGINPQKEWLYYRKKL